MSIKKYISKNLIQIFRKINKCTKIHIYLVSHFDFNLILFLNQYHWNNLKTHGHLPIYFYFHISESKLHYRPPLHVVYIRCKHFLISRKILNSMQLFQFSQINYNLIVLLIDWIHVKFFYFAKKMYLKFFFRGNV